MKRALFVVFSFVFLASFVFETIAQTADFDNPFRRLTFGGGLQRPPQKSLEQSKSSQIKDIRLFGENVGVVFTSDTLYRTDDNGETWREIALRRGAGETISGMTFEDGDLWIVLADLRNGGLSLVKLQNGEQFHSRAPIVLKTEHLTEASLDRVEFIGAGKLKLRLASSSNFVREVIYQATDDGQNWEFVEHSMEKNTETETLGNATAEAVFGNTRWILKADGNCEGFKIGCRQTTEVFANEKEITPPTVKELARIEKGRAKMEAENSVFAWAPGGTTRISLNRGFDKCTAAPASQMQTWWNTSWFYDANIYMSGRNRGCSQPQLTAAWVDQVSAQGWGLIPTIVGYQSPCSVCTTCQKHSSDPATAEQQGRGEADIAVTDAANLGLTAGSVLYYDMERYDDLSGTGACSTPTKSFLKGWTDRVKELGYKSGVYGSPTNAVGDWLSIPIESRMDAVWLARWDNVMSVWTYNAPSPVVPETAWSNHQRIKQWQAPHNETWGGVTFNIDGNIADGPVASAAIAKNKRADFDGDGKSDIAVWRPSNGVWYITNSASSTYTIQGFGLSTDILTPGDFDGDGKTDLAVWRPDNGVWHIYSRSIYVSYQFGTSGDIPVAADYDGDGRTDLAVFRPSNGVWYIKNSFDSRGTSYTIQAFGLAGDLPIPNDYDGDGKADIAVFRPSDNVWYLLRSTTGFTAIQFGLTGDKPVPADFDGDGNADLGVYRNGSWFIERSQAGSFSINFGLPNDIPAVGDFDGDGKYDVAVFRPETGVWYAQQSLAGFLAVQFGVTGDKPVETGYLP